MPGARRRGRPRTAWMATSRRGQDSPCKSQSEWQRTEINGESTSKVWPTLADRGRLKNRTADGTEAATVDHYFPSSTENVSFEPCLRTPGNRLTIVLWRGLVLPTRVTQLQLQLVLSVRRSVCVPFRVPKDKRLDLSTPKLDRDIVMTDDSMTCGRAT